ncbi:helix-turn-helix domain-containing protein [Acrocarpospora catenulata]|uniref:helix-turn-helix domain-containing protein n=1 Tax=Acrocarpospora catenulata TaxID=2836182 RepID=UPI001BDAF9B9|nr:helix-turn-helix transcriptional regulator [Acrocarpospora catenulata]
MTHAPSELIVIPSRGWRHPMTQRALQERDIRALFLLAQKYGATQTRLAHATGLLQGRVSEIIRGSRKVTALDVLERIADGLAMPDDARMAFGLAPQHPVGLDHLGPVGRAEIINVFPSQSTAAQDIRLVTRDATRLDVLAVRGLGLLGLNDSLLRPGLATEFEDQRRLRVLLLDPSCEAAHRRAQEIGESHESFAGGITLAEARLRELAARATWLAVEVFRYTTTPVWRIISLDEIQYVSAFGEGWEGHESAVYKIAPSPQGVLHRGFRRTFDTVLAAAERVI